ncbi:hypothetical protein F511_06393 [Dorcoceras hygrometricum]|uniref:Uncharacterized protein n=1 Tax=Dorcoceras hygrometricum TaxID=472368 RepID=A0A2Z7AK22_9LAMI|nr:hypothetical protein F511_06393 [Dorcoceras hygrometricum]
MFGRKEERKGDENQRGHVQIEGSGRGRFGSEELPRHVLLESEAVKHYGVRAKPLEPGQGAQAQEAVFLVELPKFPEERVPRRVRSGIQMSAKDRLESLLLARRSSSDLSIMKPPSIAAWSR